MYWIYNYNGFTKKKEREIKKFFDWKCCNFFSPSESVSDSNVGMFKPRSIIQLDTRWQSKPPNQTHCCLCLLPLVGNLVSDWFWGSHKTKKQKNSNIFTTITVCSFLFGGKFCFRWTKIFHVDVTQGDNEYNYSFSYHICIFIY